MPDRHDQIIDEQLGHPRHSAVDDVQGVGFGVVMAALGMHILTHMGFVTGQTTGLAVLIAHVTGLPFPAVYFAVTLPFLGLAWKRMGASLGEMSMMDFEPRNASATALDAVTGTVVRLPANVPHALDAAAPARMLLVMLK